MIDPYEVILKEQINKIDGIEYEDIKFLDRYPLSVAKKVLKILIENACLGQNCRPIELAREKMNEIDKVWLKQYFIETACDCINFSDEWEYRRLVELVIIVIPDLKKQVFELGADSENEEVREVIEDYYEIK